MASKNETVEEVCGELKEVANGNNVSNDGRVVEISQEEIWGALDRIEAAHKRDVKELCKCLKAAVDDYFKNQCPRCMGCRSTLRCEFRGWQAVLEKYMKSEGGNDGK